MAARLNWAGRAALRLATRRVDSIVKVVMGGGIDEGGEIDREVGEVRKKKDRRRRAD